MWGQSQGDLLLVLGERSRKPEYATKSKRNQHDGPQELHT